MNHQVYPSRRATLSQSRHAAGVALWLALSILSAAPLRSGAQADSPAPDFTREVQPILARACYECHGDKKQKSGLRLDRKAGAFGLADSGQIAIQPGNPASSPLFLRISSQDEDEVMPPKEPRLNANEIARIKRWIEQGAAWPDEGEAAKPHWAYVPPQRPEPPTTRSRGWTRNPIDAFVLARLEAEGLEPSPEAPRPVLLRRAALDLTGLPPAPEQAQRFQSSSFPNAYETEVDRLLDSPAYGERWARPWLDLARYADTQGYEKDNRRSIWPYRDWVIHAFNQNMPFDRFTLEQIAGDLLPDPSQPQLVATGFHRNTMTNTEGGTDDEEFRHEAVIDRINTTWSAWMGTTFGCAQCHNHKYDPFSMKDYYQTYAFFNNTRDNDQPDESPTLLLTTPAQEAQIRQFTDRIARLTDELNQTNAALTEARTHWDLETTAALARWQALAPTRAASTGGATLHILDDSSVLASGANPSNDVYSILASAPFEKVAALRLEVLPDPSLRGSQGRGSNGGFVLTEIQIAARTPGEHFVLPPFTRANADFSQEGYSVTNLLRLSSLATAAVSSNAGWAVVGKSGGRREELSAYLMLDTPAELPAGAALEVRFIHGSAEPEANLGRFRISLAAEPDPAPAPKLPAAIRKVMAVPAANRTADQKRQIEDYWRSIASELKEVRDQIAAVRRDKEKLEAGIPRTSIMRELEKPRATHMLARGSFLSKGTAVEADVPELFRTLAPIGGPADAATHGRSWNRLDLARWLVSTNNPLTARVIMNRIWEQYFGTGLVETSEDFGTQGEAPSHPDLLDWLATEFMRQNWNLKAMHRLIVTSATYRQAAGPRPDLDERDPANRLLARGPRVRLEAEMIRDQSLAVSGLLSRKIGGPSVMPPQPDGLWAVVYSGDSWQTSAGDDRYRRGLYTFWRRSMPHPVMTTFDAPTREFCVLKRTRSNTPLQALVLMNDPAYLDASRALAERVLAESEPNVTARIHRLFWLCLNRPPRADETEQLTRFQRETLQQFAADPDAARSFLEEAKGAAPRNSTVPEPELAAWTCVANLLLNLDEMISKG